ncbi:MAG: V-type ATP synthase subunit B [Gemmatimonadota bacterium]
MRVPPRTYQGAAAAAGPLLFLPGTPGAVLGERVRIESEGTELRGQVIDAGTDVTVVQVMEDTVGLAAGEVLVTLSGEHLRSRVGKELLGRVLSGTGNPLDGLPDPIGEAVRSVWGAPMNPVRRRSPSEFIETGLSAVDGLNTLVRGQKLPVFSGPGLPALELAAQIVEGAKPPGGRPFAVIFVAIGITERETRSFLGRFHGAEASGRTVVYLNRASDPTIERLLAPRVALTQAEYLAYELGTDVLVVLADLTHYCEALRELAAARQEVPGRRGYPGYLYTDLASLYERAGILRDAEGSVTQIPVLTMPDDDITHPIPDLTGYITEGQIVLSRELYRSGVYPPIDVLPSLSRLMNAGIGEGRTRPEHRQWANQLYALYATGREARLTAAIVGESGLPESDRTALAFAERFEREFVGQGRERRDLNATIELGWRLLETVPREMLVRIDDEAWARRRAARSEQETESVSGGDGDDSGGDTDNSGGAA